MRMIGKIVLFLLMMVISLPNVALAKAGFGDHDDRENVHHLWSTPEYNKIVFFWNDTGLCTAQYVWYNLVLTARHCIVDNDKFDNYEKVGKIGGKIRSASLDKSEVVIEDYGRDLMDDWALLRITDPKLYSDNYFDLNPKTLTQTVQTAGFGWCRILADDEIDKIKQLFMSHPYYYQVSFGELWDGIYRNGKKVYDGVKDQALRQGIPTLDDFDESTKTPRLKTHRNCHIYANTSFAKAESDCDITQGNSGGPSFNGRNINGLVSAAFSSWSDSTYTAYMVRTERYNEALDKLRRKYPLSNGSGSISDNNEKEPDDVAPNTPNDVAPSTPNNVTPNTPSVSNDAQDEDLKQKGKIVIDDSLKMTVGEAKTFKILFQGASIGSRISDKNIASVEVQNIKIISAELSVVAKSAGVATISLTTVGDDRFKETTKDITLTVEPQKNNTEAPQGSGNTDVVPETPSSPGSDAPSQNKGEAIIKVEGLASENVMKVGGIKMARVVLNMGGDLSVSLSDENVARVTFDGRNLNVIAKSPGNTVLTLTAAETDNYRKTSKEYKITVQGDSQRISANLTNTIISNDLFEDDIGGVSSSAAQQKMNDLDSNLTSKLPDIPDMSRMEMLNFLEQVAYYNFLRDRYEKARARELAPANKILSALSIGATGIGGMMVASALSEQKADEQAERDMRAYINTMRCEYGNGMSVRGGEINVELPGGNALSDLYTEYTTLANDLKMRKDALGLVPGIESQFVDDKSDSGLYDYESSGVTNGGYASVYRALMNPDGEDAEMWNAQKDKTANTLKIGGTVAAGGAIGGLVGNVVINGLDGESGLLQLDEEDSGWEEKIGPFKWSDFDLDED